MFNIRTWYMTQEVVRIDIQRFVYLIFIYIFERLRTDF